MNDLKTIEEATSSIHNLVQQLEREGTVAEWWTEAATENLVKLNEALAALKRMQEQEPVANVRPAVRWFAEQMEVTLQKNDHKGGWAKCSDDYLIARAVEELGELLRSKSNGNVDVAECIDVANMLMMLADNHMHRIGDERATPQPPTAPVVTHLNMDPEASPETKEAVGEVVKAAYAYKPPAAKALTDEEIKRHKPCYHNGRGLVMGGNKLCHHHPSDTGAEIVVAELNKAYQGGMRYARDNGYLSSTPSLSQGLVEAGESLEATMATWPGDWASDKRLAWIWGIVHGRGNAMDEVSQKFKWDTDTVSRLHRLHAAWDAAKSSTPTPPTE